MFFNVNHVVTSRDKLSTCQLVSELIAFEFEKEFPHNTEEERIFEMEIKEFISALYSHGYPSDGALSLIRDTIKTLNFCG